jgi:hypothetical protein
MGAESDNDDLGRLNALVDGELAPVERAAMAARLAEDRDLARAHATLARLKANVVAMADADQQISLPPARRKTQRLAAATAACAVLAGIAVLFAYAELPLHRLVAPAVPIDATEITFASLPARTTVPRLESAGLKLVGVAIETHADHPLVNATYRGPHGCRLDLRAWPVGTAAPFLAGTHRHGWVVGEIAYELVAHGMPEWRFAILSEVAERQTRQVDDPKMFERRLRQAAVGAPPCVG